MEENTKYYHGLAGGIPFWHSKEILDESIKTLKSIFELGGLYCRNNLKKFGIHYDEKEAIYNGNDYISICIDNPSSSEFTGPNFGIDSSFFRYVKKKIGIEFKPEITENCIFRQEPYRRLPGERQILKFIDISNIERILVGLPKELEEQAINEINKICSPYNIPVTTFEKLEQQKETPKTLTYKKEKK